LGSSARAWRPEQQQVLALFQPSVAGGQCCHARAAQHGHVVELEAVEGLVRRQARIGQVTLDAAAFPPNLHESATAEALQAICDLDLSELQVTDPPRGFRRD